jgi:predicted alpha/beta superfamily hydrolase
MKKNKNSTNILRITGKILFLFILIFNFVSLNAQDFPNVDIPGTQLRTIHSSIVGQEYKLHINLPGDFQDTTKTFPVVYLLDSQWDFPLLQAIYGEQYFDGFLPGLIVVGITWGGENPDPDKLSYRDFTPTDIKSGQPSGNAPNFIKFIEKELVPFMEANYRASKTDRTLMGSSLGGLFTLYALFNHTNLFNRYVLTSPALSWDNGVTYKYESDYAAKNSKLPAKVFIAFGGFETDGLPGFKKLVSQIKERNYEGLELQTKIIEGIGHSGGKADGYTRGLQFVFVKPSIDVDAAILEQYTGEYQYAPQAKMKIVVEDGHLALLFPFSTKIILDAETENDFYTKGQYLFVHFKKDNEGKVTGFLLQRYGGEGFVKKINE